MNKPAQEKLHFKGFISPRYTQVPDELFDDLMAHLSGAELKVLLYIIRRTFGFKKDADNISLGQICKGITTRDGDVLDIGTGLSKQSVISALKGLLEKNAIVASQNSSKEKGYEPTTYSLNLLPLSNNLTRGGLKNGQGLVQKLDTQETVLQETVNNTVNGVVKGGKEKETSGIEKLKPLVQPKDQTEYVVQHILEELGDEKSKAFYYLVASRIPEQVIRLALSEIKGDGAKNPAKLFTHKIKQYALKKNKKGLLKEME